MVKVAKLNVKHLKTMSTNFAHSNDFRLIWIYTYFLVYVHVSTGERILFLIFYFLVYIYMGGNGKFSWFKPGTRESYVTCTRITLDQNIVFSHQHLKQKIIQVTNISPLAPSSTTLSSYLNNWSIYLQRYIENVTNW